MAHKKPAEAGLFQLRKKNPEKAVFTLTRRSMAAPSLSPVCLVRPPYTTSMTDIQLPVDERPQALYSAIQIFIYMIRGIDELLVETR
jgi:hypothetical protein